METRSTILADVSKLVMEAQTVHYPKFQTKNSAAGQLHGMSVYWGQEGGPLQDSGPNYAELLFVAQKLYGFVHVTNEVLKDSVGAFEASLKMAIIENLRNEIERCIFRGNGVSSPHGIIGSDGQTLVNRQTANTVTYQDFRTMYSRLYPQGISNSIWYVSPSAFPSVLNLTQGTDNWVEVVPNANGELTLLGRPLRVSEFCSALGSQGGRLLDRPEAVYPCDA